MDLWHGSDHDLAMDHATPQAVLGDFENAEFTHIAFDDLVKLTDAELAEVVRAVPVYVWSVALTDASAGLRRAVLDLMSDDDRAEVGAELAWLEGKASEAIVDGAEETESSAPQFFAPNQKVVRPCDVADAHQAIGDAAPPPGARRTDISCFRRDLDDDP